DPARGRARLLERCCEEALAPDGTAAAAGALPAAIEARVAEAMDEADPTAAMTTTADCPGCGHTWEAAIDVAAFLWREISATARRLLREVHELASRYGWSESQILRLSTARRYA